MSDPNLKEKEKMPPLRVMGLTGPLASGCSTVSRMFDEPGRSRRDGNQFLRELKGGRSVRRVGGWEVSIDWESVNSRIEKLYESRIRDCRDYGAYEECEEVRKALHDVLQKELEVREALHGLQKVRAYYTAQGHLFRTLSVSDLIVFHTLLAIEKRGVTLTGISSKYKEFIEVVFENVESIMKALKRSRIESFQQYYDLLYSQKDIKKIRSVARAFGWLHGVANRIKRSFRKRAPEKYTGFLQDFGDNLRRCGDPFIEEGGPDSEQTCILARDVAQMIQVLYGGGIAAFFVVDCLRNPYEIICLRNTFANFFVVSLFDSKESRLERYKNKAMETWGERYDEEVAAETFEKAERRDSGSYIERSDELLYKQNVTKCVQISDVAINNYRVENEGRESLSLHSKVLRVVCLILSPGCTKPTNDEVFMNLAYTMAVKSNCISKQVGAVIVGPQGYIVGAGWNDVGEGRVSCGLRVIRDLEYSEEFVSMVEAIRENGESVKDLISRLCQRYRIDSGEEHPEQYCFCFKDEMVKKDVKTRLIKAYNERVDRIVEGSEAEREEYKKNGERILKELVEEGHLHQLEYCLALHAEENAIIQSAKIGGMGLRGGTIYSTALPCTLCAKKIQQVGIKRVVYTEPYPKSFWEIYMAFEPVQFEGIKPRAYVRLFMPHHDQKEWQDLESRNLVPVI